jgi:hypothetical protein
MRVKLALYNLSLVLFAVQALEFDFQADTMRLIWSYGATDDIEYHGTSRGTKSINLLDPPMPPLDLSE